MNAPKPGWSAAALAAIVSLAAPSAAPGAGGDCTLTVAQRKFEGAERTIVTMANGRIAVEVAPDLEGRIITYRDRSRPACAFEWLDDCPYHYAGRWEGKPFSHQVVAGGPETAAVAVEGGGKIAPRLLRDLLGIELTAPLDLKVRRVMTIERGSTRLKVQVQVTNVGASVAPQFRYMVHGVFGQVPPMRAGRAFWFLPTSGGVEFFDAERGSREMGASAGSGGAAIDHPFSRFIKGRKADKPRYEPAGWAAVLTSAGPTFIYYDPAQYDFMQYWFGGDAEWHYTFEPHTRPADLRPGESMSFAFTLAYDAADVPFGTPTVALRPPDVPTEASPGDVLPIEVRGTTVCGQAEKAAVVITVKDPAGKETLSREIAGEVKPLEFSSFAAELRLPADAPLGKYAWQATSGGRKLAEGPIDVVTPQQLAKLRMERLTAAVREKYEAEIKKLREEAERARKRERLWQEGSNFALSLGDPHAWPDTAPPAGSAVTIRRGVVPVVGLWKAAEAPRIAVLAPAALPTWPAEAEVEKGLAALGKDRADLRDLAATPDGKELVALLASPERKRVEVVRMAGGRVAKRFGRFADQPGEGDDRLGANSRAVAVDAEGNVWVATNAWGQTSIFRVNQDGAPYEESVQGPKGAVKKFDAEGRLLGAVPLLAAPMDLAIAKADGAEVALATFRHVGSYHGAQVREGTMLIRAADARRIGEIKAPGGSICVDAAGRAWIADVAGHIACHDLRGRRLLDVADSAPPAQGEANLAGGVPLPVVLRADGKGGILALDTLGRKISLIAADGKMRPAGEKVPESVGALHRLAVSAAGAVVIGTQGIWRPR